MRGLACHLPCDRCGALLPHLFTLTRQRRAVYFLCHFPSGHPDRELPGASLSGVRTFLYHHANKSGVATAVARPTTTEYQRPHYQLPLAISFLANTVLLELSYTDYYGASQLTQSCWNYSDPIREASSQEIHSNLPLSILEDWALRQSIRSA